MNAGNPYSATREKALKGDVGVTADKTEGEEEGMGEIQSRMWMVGLSTRCMVLAGCCAVYVHPLLICYINASLQSTWIPMTRSLTTPATMVSLSWSLDRDNFKKITMKSSTFEMSTSRYYFKAGITCLCSINMVKVNGSIATASDVGEFWIRLPSCISESTHPKDLRGRSASPHQLKSQQSPYP